ncbi:unnamed protein product [Ectocarpus sp. 13 AM-2016]
MHLKLLETCTAVLQLLPLRLTGVRWGAGFVLLFVVTRLIFERGEERYVAAQRSGESCSFSCCPLSHPIHTICPPNTTIPIRSPLFVYTLSSFLLSPRPTPKLLAHPLTQPYISDGDQLALSYLEAVAVHKATSTAAAVAASGAAAGAADGDKGRTSGASEEEKEEVSESVGGEGEKLDDDDDVGFRVTFTFRENPFFSNSELWREWEPADEKAAFSAVKWKDTDESRDLQSCLLWNLDPALQEETPSFFSIFGDDMEDYELGEALRGDITDNPLDIYMRHDFDAEAPEEEEEGGAAAQPEGEEEGGEYDGGVNQIGVGLEEGGGETIVDEG